MILETAVTPEKRKLLSGLFFANKYTSRGVTNQRSFFKIMPGHVAKACSKCFKIVFEKVNDN